jgi:DNA helicase INO80
MFRDPVRRPSVEDEERDRRRRPGEAPPSRDAYHPQSPSAQTPSRLHHPLQSSPTQSHHSQYTSHQHPPTSSSRGTALPPISTALYARDTTSANTYYDPTSDGDRRLSQPATRYEGHYPQQVCRHHPHLFPSPLDHITVGTFMQGCGANIYLQQSRDSHAYADGPYTTSYRSPITSSYAQQSPLQRPPSHGHITAGMETAMSHSPMSPTAYQSINRGAVQPPPPHYERRPSVKDEVSQDCVCCLPSMLTIATATSPSP